MSSRIDGDKSGQVPKAVRRIFRGPQPESVPGLVGTAVMIVGLLDIAAGVFPRFRHSRFHSFTEVLPGSLGPFAAALSISAGVLILLLAHGLKRRKRRAWRAAVVLLPAGAVAQFTYRHSVIGVVIAAVLLALLLRHQSEFKALPDPRSRWKALANFVLMSATPSASAWSSSTSTRTRSSATRACTSRSRTSSTGSSASRARSSTPDASPGPSATPSARSAC